MIDPRIQAELDARKAAMIASMTPRRRCVYMGGDGLQCEVWFPAVSDSKLCPEHSKTISPNGINLEVKQRFIDLVNETKDLVYKMSLDEIDTHIAQLETELEKQKTIIYASRAVRAERLDTLTEEERAKRRSIKITKAVTEVRTKRPTMKSDPVRYMMQNQNLTEEEAKEVLYGDPETMLIKKYMRKNNCDEKTAKEGLGL